MTAIELRIEAKAKSEILCQLVDKCGSRKAAAEEVGVCLSTFSAWVNFRTQPCLHTVGKNPEKYKGVFLRLEQLTGRSIYEIFPKLPKGAKKLLSKKHTRTKTVDVLEIGVELEAEKLTYEQDFDRQILIEQAHGELEKAFKTLSHREREILKLRYGWGDGHTYTLEEVGHIFKLNKERIRQIEATAIRKLQQPSRAGLLTAGWEL